MVTNNGDAASHIELFTATVNITLLIQYNQYLRLTCSGYIVITH